MFAFLCISHWTNIVLANVILLMKSFLSSIESHKEGVFKNNSSSPVSIMYLVCNNKCFEAFYVKFMLKLVLSLLGAIG